MATKKALGKSRLEWFLEFINLDMDHASDGDRAKWAVEISALLGSGFNLDAMDMERSSVRHGIVDRIGESVLSRTDLRFFQDELRDFFNVTMLQIQATVDHPNQGWMLEETVDAMPAFNRLDIPSLSVELRGDTWWEEKVETTPEGEKKRFRRCPPEALADMTFDLSFMAPTTADALKLQFCMSLDGLPINAFRQCQECSSWFIHLSNREREFCSNRCASRHGVRRRREKMKYEDPAGYDAELKANSERAHRQYTKKLQSSGKPARRPYKHKEE